MRNPVCYRPTHPTYFTATVIPDWVLFEPTVIDSEAAPDGVFGGMVTFTCITPETKPGASP